MLNNELLAENIRKYRIKKGLTQTELADKLFISAQAVSKWETGKSVPDLVSVCALSEIFSVSVDMLIGEQDGEKISKVFIAIDGGGTKTEFVMLEESGNVLRTISLGGSNPNVCGIEKTTEILKTGIDSLLAINLDVSGIFGGIAGISIESNMKAIKNFFKKNYPGINVFLSSDILNVMSSIPEIEKCVAAICGTGFSIFANDGKSINRVGGWGYLIDKLGSGFDIGRDALGAALAENDGFGEKTILTDMIQNKLGDEVWNCIPEIYAGGNSYIASLAPIVFEAYEKGDKVAAGIMDENSARVAELVNFAVERYKCDNNVILSGGVFNKSASYVRLVSEKLDRKINVLVPEFPQIFGACVKCVKIFGTYNSSFETEFRNTYYTK